MSQNEGHKRWRFDRSVDMGNVITLVVFLVSLYSALNYRAKHETEMDMRLSQVEKLAAVTADALQKSCDNLLQISVILKEQRARCDEDHTTVKALERLRWEAKP